MDTVKTSSFQLPNATTVDVVLVKLPNGKIVARHPDELVARPIPPVTNR
jgi:hypothetical protein